MSSDWQDDGDNDGPVIPAWALILLLAIFMLIAAVLALTSDRV